MKLTLPPMAMEGRMAIFAAPTGVKSPLARCGAWGRGRCSRFHAALYTSLAILHTKQRGWCMHGSAAHSQRRLQLRPAVAEAVRAGQDRRERGVQACERGDGLIFSRRRVMGSSLADCVGVVWWHLPPSLVLPGDIYHHHSCRLVTSATTTRAV